MTILLLACLLLALTATSVGSARGYGIHARGPFASTQTRHSSYPPPPRWLAKLIHQTFPGDERRATCIAWAESRYKPKADNGISYGLFEIHQRTWDWRYNPRAIPIVGKVDWRRIYEPAYNAKIARKIYLHNGRSWKAWVTARGCGG